MKGGSGDVEIRLNGGYSGRCGAPLNELIAIAGLVGTPALAYALFGADHMFPRWRRVTLGLVALSAVLTFWIVRPVIPWMEGATGAGCASDGSFC